jgi:hypothetical protein
MTYIRVTREGLRLLFCIAEGAKNLPFTCSTFAVRPGKAQSSLKVVLPIRKHFAVIP